MIFLKSIQEQSVRIIQKSFDVEKSSKIIEKYKVKTFFIFTDYNIILNS